MGAVIYPEPSPMLTRDESCLLKVRLNRLRQCLVSSGSSSRRHMGNQMGSIFLTRLGDVDGCHLSSVSLAFCRSGLLDHKVS